MKGGILAAGFGERLRDSGNLKPLTMVAGRPLISHVLHNFVEAGVDNVTAIINDDSLAVRDAAERERWPFALRWLVETTPSSMHSFLRLVEALADDGSPGPFLISTVDTVLPAGALRAFLDATNARSETAVALAITPPSPDDNPLWLECDASGALVALGQSAIHREQVTAGVYLVRPTVLAEAAAARSDGLGSLRSFLARLLERGYSMDAISIGNSVDVDRPADIIAAENLLHHPT